MVSSGPFRNAGHSRPAGPITVKSDRIRSLMAGRGSFLARRWLGGGKGASKSRKKRLCRLMCGKPLAFRRRQPPSSPRLGWKAQPSSRAVGVGHGGSPRKGEAFPHSRRQSRFGMLLFGDFNTILVAGPFPYATRAAGTLDRPCTLETRRRCPLRLKIQTDACSAAFRWKISM